jgi:ADP-dependent NAD(P)H-hydrate dehydratase / NAD(P)H-hydrate epimerase
MQVLTGASMREADRRTIEEIGIASPVLMESAGRAVARVMEERIEELEDLSIAVVCGKGNNGGDGLVVLRTLLLMGYDATAFVLAPFDSLSADAAINLRAARELGLPVESVPTEQSWLDALSRIATADVVVDAILGTGLSAALHGLYRKAIVDLNGLDSYRVALDVPSGLSSDSGVVPGEAFEADLTVALAAPKVCHFIPPACDHCGDVEVVEIGIPPRFLVGPEPRIETLDPEELALLLTPRSPRSHKGTYGHLLVVAGSVGKTGAAIMAAEAALRSGVGLVTVASAKSAIPMMAPRLPEAMWVPLPETDSGAIAHEARPRLEELLRERSALAIGPGLGLHEETVRLVQEVVSGLSIPAVVDADAVNALATSGERTPPGGRICLTPHPGEAGRLLGQSAAEVERDRVRSARKLAAERGTHVVLKGYRTLVSDLAGNLKVNLTGNPGMATGGTGDVLTGILGGLLAQGIAIEDALGLGVYLHGYAGDLAAADLGETSLIATDVIEKLPRAFRDLEAFRP